MVLTTISKGVLRILHLNTASFCRYSPLSLSIVVEQDDKMIGPYLDRLNQLAIVLASGSPRRKELLEQIGLKFAVVPSTFEENLNKKAFSAPAEYARKNSELKAKQVSETSHANLIIGCDTIVTVGGLILEKPRSTEEAKSMISETTYVEFSSLSDDVIEAYIATEEPFDKAGGYGIQGSASAFVRGIRGDYFNVVGFPINHFCRELDQLIKNGSLKFLND
ncbi:uncharacterized protein LOC111251900 isoform X2 [Varroa destructor]|uniref:Maf-like protein n=1 Tax=Varroa destructor TaxID=109461 RepID=A0A7M7MBS3_VARDE|nr:uncharacterized protein LOC111251900 isoform X2 [Varroa destructor]